MPRGQRTGGRRLRAFAMSSPGREDSVGPAVRLAARLSARWSARESSACISCDCERERLRPCVRGRVSLQRALLSRNPLWFFFAASWESFRTPRKSSSASYIAAACRHRRDRALRSLSFAQLGTPSRVVCRPRAANERRDVVTYALAAGFRRVSGRERWKTAPRPLKLPRTTRRRGPGRSSSAQHNDARRLFRHAGSDAASAPGGAGGLKVVSLPNGLDSRNFKCLSEEGVRPANPSTDFAYQSGVHGGTPRHEKADAASERAAANGRTMTLCTLDTSSLHMGHSMPRPLLAARCVSISALRAGGRK